MTLRVVKKKHRNTEIQMGYEWDGYDKRKGEYDGIRIRQRAAGSGRSS